MRKTIVIINGTGSSGKDTVDEIVSKYHKTYRIDSVEIPKYILGLSYVGWDGVKTPEARIALSKLKRVLSEFNDCIFINMTARVEVFMSDSFDDVYAFVHIREKPEIDRLHDYCVDRVTVLRSVLSWDIMREIGAMIPMITQTTSIRMTMTLFCTMTAIKIA